jgi:hypothetical protein
MMPSISQTEARYPADAKSFNPGISDVTSANGKDQIPNTCESTKIILNAHIFTFWNLDLIVNKNN